MSAETLTLEDATLAPDELADALLSRRADQIEPYFGARTAEIIAALGGSEHSEAQLKQWVEMSVTANESVRQVAEMTRSVREVDYRTQSIASAVEELSATVQSISGTSEQAANEAKEAVQVSESGRRATTDAVAAMGAVFDVVQSAVDKVETLAEASNKIGEIISTIEAIAKQTNLLALNATIEAARAGEAGKGFAVVAGEVKGLANQTAEATDDIRTRITELRSEMDVIVGVMRDGAEKVENGRESIDAAGTEMDRLAAGISSVTDRMEQVAGILIEQESATDEIAAGISVVAQMSGENVELIDGAITTLERTAPIIAESINGFVQQGTANATIHAAKSDHMIWMRRLAQMLAGRAMLNPDELADHHSCRLGKWYDSQTDAELTGHPAWSALVEPHKEVHRAGIAAAEAFSAGNLDEAIQLVHQAGMASDEVMRLLNELSGAQSS
ncbi:methyl-accepting chemotaxis protein [Nisaea acidiphila]|uniref:Methyl-accepting chemotaxis protein n=1 Tax=Nisaea acidiphila TaxID=1862145 RepID=A0A9J7AVH5_9PROT|nr:methyl-accepting chemotaxis protein [Nisaea acidiphila]UUX50802.1 methyl-accepting chemotaxis protein [Nisaea acidiphila]